MLISIWIIFCKSLTPFYKIRIFCALSQYYGRPVPKISGMRYQKHLNSSHTKAY